MVLLADGEEIALGMTVVLIDKGVEMFVVGDEVVVLVGSGFALVCKVDFTVNLDDVTLGDEMSVLI